MFVWRGTLALLLMTLGPTALASELTEDPCVSPLPEAPACRPRAEGESHESFCKRILVAKSAGNPGYDQAYCDGENFDVRWIPPSARPKPSEKKNEPILQNAQGSPTYIGPRNMTDTHAPGAGFAELLGLVIGGLPVMTYEALGGKCESKCNNQGYTWKSYGLAAVRLIPTIPVRGINTTTPAMKAKSITPLPQGAGGGNPPEIPVAPASVGH